MESLRYLKPETSRLLQNLGDRNFFLAAMQLSTSALDLMQQTYVPNIMTEAQFTILRNNLGAMSQNIFAFSHRLFSNVYEEPNGIELVNNFLTLLKSLPHELLILQTKRTNFFEFRVKSIFDNEIKESLRALTDKKILEVMFTHQTFQAFSEREKTLFMQILIELKNNYLRHTNIEDLQVELLDTVLLTAENVEATLGIALPKVKEIAEELDRQVKSRFDVLVMIYLQHFMPLKNSISAVKFVLQELTATKSSLAFFNKQLKYPLTSQRLSESIEKIFQPKFDRGETLSVAEEPNYAVCVLAKFFGYYPEVQLTKANSVVATHQLLSMIAGGKSTDIKVKLIQFQILFSLAKIYANEHKNPRTDRLLKIGNTRTWRALMADIRNTAYAQLVNPKNYPQHAQTHHYLPVLQDALKLPLFNEHRNNYSPFFFRNKTHTVKKIQATIASLQRPPREVVIRLTT